MNSKTLQKPVRWLFFAALLLLFCSSAWAQNRTITGTVIDDKGEVVPFASIYVPFNASGTQTNMDGRFSLTIPSEATTIEVSFIGFKKQQITLTASTNYDIRLESEAAAIEGVVIVGSFERKKESFTGAFNTVEGRELKQVGSQNLVESLKSLDPSFVVMENMSLGANPNAMPTIEVRGQTSINIEEVDDIYANDPNQPLFILDGFETTLQKIVDLDFNRVESVTVLKDAASTAFYGSRAANGVVVVETVKGEAGPWRFFYTGDFTVQTPNLNSYNMMNSAEKLEFERLSGRYLYDMGRTDPYNSTTRALQADLDALYASRLADVQRGVNTYWMSEPLRTALINRQSLRFTGGNKETVFNGAFSYRSAPGVMKGSGRDSWTGDLDVVYNKGTFTFTNRLGLSGFSAEESPYGAFSEWVNANPYYTKTDENGEIKPWLEEVKHPTLASLLDYKVGNPLYNATLNSINEAKNTGFDERFNLRWMFYKGMRIEGQFQVSQNSTNSIRYTPPEHTSYETVEQSLKGYYSNATSKNNMYMANLMYVWDHKIGKHSWVANARGEIAHNNTNNTSWAATGFPMGGNGRPSFASGYVDDVPGYTNTTYRRVNGLASINYSYNNRYLFDATFRMDGSTVFGSAKKWTPFWSGGIGWNMHEEDFLKNIRWISQMKLRATLGQTGNQNLGSTASSSIYSYVTGGTVFGPNLLVYQLGNENIEWQKTTTANLALDVNLFNGRLSGKVEVYRKVTDPLVVPVDQAPSTGTKSYPMSLGNMTYKGFEFDLTYGIIRSKDWSWRVKAMGAMAHGEYGNFSDKIEGMNQERQNSESMQRFKDGYSPKTLWAVQSLGIDPSTGQEVFLDRFGNPTYLFDPADATAIGIEEPTMMGTISSFLTYKEFTFILIMRYSWGADVFNRALYDKVENISFAEIAYNQDRRALTERWQKPGDITEFKAIGTTSTTPISSRFMQNERYLTGESIGLSWRLNKNKHTWMDKALLQNLSFNLTFTGTGGVFRLSNIKRERGTLYPEATTITLSINASF